MECARQEAATKPIIPIAAALALNFAPAVLAADADPFENPFQRGTKDAVSVSLGGFVMNFDTLASVDSASGSGTDIHFESDLSLPAQTTRVRLDGYWRMSKRHRLDYGWLYYNRERNRSIDEEIDFGDAHFDIGANLDTKMENQLFKVSYRYSYVRNERVDAAVSGGLSTFFTKISLAGNGSVNGQPVAFVDEKKNVIAPVPVIGMHADVKIVKTFFFRADAQWFGIRVSDLEGRLTDARASFDWYPLKHFGFGTGYNRLRIRVEDSTSAKFVVSYRFSGLLLYATYVW